MYFILEIIFRRRSSLDLPDWLHYAIGKPIGIDHGSARRGAQVGRVILANFLENEREDDARGSIAIAATEKGPILVVAKMHLAQFLATLPTKTVENKLVDITIKEPQATAS